MGKKCCRYLSLLYFLHPLSFSLYYKITTIFLKVEKITALKSCGQKGDGALLFLTLVGPESGRMKESRPFIHP